MHKKALVVNCSGKHYNLGAHKLFNWLTAQGVMTDFCNGDPGMFADGFDLVCLSVIFSYHAPVAREIAFRVRGNAEVWCGGPGMFRLLDWWKTETGLDAHKGLDKRFDLQRGSYKYAFAARGCPVGCSFCIVPGLEGYDFTYDWEFQPAPILCDNNLSAQPDLYQWNTIRRYQESGTRLIDAQSGFEPATFTEDTYFNWKPILKGPWRFALDEIGELNEVKDMMRILGNESPRRKQVYVLTGNEPIAQCFERATKVIEWGGEPYCQFIMPLNWLGGPRPTPHDWTEQAGADFSRYYNRHLYHSIPIQEYRPRKSEPPPFATFH